MKLLAGYLAAVNLCGLIIMVMGKRHRKDKEKRIVLTRAIWIISALGGSIGTIAGMYLFHHKDRKLKYVIGLPLILIAQLALILFGRNYLKERNARPSSVVDRQLSRLKKLDSDAAMQIISYENLAAPESESPTAGMSGSIPEGAVSAVTRFFRDFHYRIDGSHIDGQAATVSVIITNLDTHALAQDVCRSLTERSAENLDGANSTVMTADDYYTLLDQTMANGDYEIVSKEVEIPLTLTDGVWNIDTTDQFQDDLLGGFISYINDPFLVDAQEILQIYLNAFEQMSGEQWLAYLGRNDIFSTYSASHADELDKLYTEKIAEYFSCKVESCNEQRSYPTGEADATVTVTSIDLTNVLDVYREKLLAYAGSADSITSSNAEIADASAQYLIDAFNEASQSASCEATIHLTNDGRTWTPVITKELTNIFLGDINGALENFIAERETEAAAS